MITRHSNLFLLSPVESESVHARGNDVAGTAALSICESLLLALNDQTILPENEIVGILRDAVAAHEVTDHADQAGMHATVAARINGNLAGGNSVRRR